MAEREPRQLDERQGEAGGKGKACYDETRPPSDRCVIAVLRRQIRSLTLHGAVHWRSRLVTEPELDAFLCAGEGESLLVARVLRVVVEHRERAGEEREFVVALVFPDSNRHW